ncbi:MAG: hypothetical protein ACXVHX_19550 [Solirubrobacteraceae bacterium]
MPARTWIARSHDGGATWTDDHLAGPFDLHPAPYARGYFVGDLGVGAQAGERRVEGLAAATHLQCKVHAG